MTNDRQMLAYAPTNSLAKFVRWRRRQLGLSLQKLADRAQSSKGHIHDIEKGIADNPTISTVWNLAAALQIDAVSLFRIACGMSQPKEQSNE